MTVRLLAADDHRAFLGALRVFLKAEPGVEFIEREVTRGDEVVGAVMEERPDVLLLDVDLPVVSGLDVISAAKEISPQTKIVVLTAHRSPDVIVRTIETGGSGVLSKAQPMEEVVGAIHLAAAGEIVLDPQDLSNAMREVAQDRERRRNIDLLVRQLSHREREVLGLLVQGLTNDEIARQLHLSVETARTHVRNLLRKLGVHSKLEAAAFAIRHRVVELRI